METEYGGGVDRLREPILLDTNIIINHLLGLERAPECTELLDSVAGGEIAAYFSTFGLYSTHIRLCSLGRQNVLNTLLDEIESSEGLYIYDTSREDEREIVALTEELPLDFDDALQYHIANKFGLLLVSFDKDFDKTDIKRYEPKDILGLQTVA